jgi:hypothetical protein
MERLDFARASECILQLPSADVNKNRILFKILPWRDHYGDEMTTTLVKKIYARRPEYQEALQAYARRHKWDIQFA